MEISFKIIVIGWFIFLGVTTIQQNIYATNEIAMFKRSLEYEPNHARMHISLGLSFALQKQFLKAEHHFREALKNDPSNIRARLGLGTAVMDQGRYWEGIEQYELVSNPRNLQGMLDNNINLTYQLLIEKYQDKLKDNPGNADIYYSLGVVYSKKMQFQEAINYYEKALNFNPNLYNARFNLCHSYRAIGDKEKARECFSVLE